MNLLYLAQGAGLGELQRNLVSNWIGPAFLIIVAGFAIKFIISRQFRELAGFLGIAALVALLVFSPEFLFGENGLFKSIAEGFSRLLDGGGSSNSGGTGMINIFYNFKNLK